MEQLIREFAAWLKQGFGWLVPKPNPDQATEG
jgi:hypothetical protein